MKRLKAILLIGFALITPKLLQGEYTLPTTVIEVVQPTTNEPKGIVVCEADNGNRYTFYGSEDWIEGDIAELTINDNGTTYRLDDDKVVKAIYKGWVY